MDGNLNKIIKELLRFAELNMHRYKIFPYASFVVKKDVIISRAMNFEREENDVTMQDQVVAIRRAQDTLDIGSKLTEYSIVSTFEPTILGFDVALWSGIRDFVWCIDAKTVPEFYNKINYGPLDYQKKNPGEITIHSRTLQKEALKLVEIAKKRNYYK